MAKLKYDFADESKMVLFPKHGWTANSQDVKVLWLPIRRVLTNVMDLRKERDLETESISGHRHYALSFNSTLDNLTICLRELSRITRESCEHDVDLDKEASLDKDLLAFEMAPIYIDCCFSYLRRLADLFSKASRPILFDNWKSAPSEFKKLIANSTKGDSYGPLYDINLALTQHCGWFSKLRALQGETGKKGIRDAIEHRTVRFLISKHQSGGGVPKIDIRLYSPERDVDTRQELISELRECMSDFCFFMTEICKAINYFSNYDKWDTLVRPGLDDDYVGFWPEL